MLYILFIIFSALLILGALIMLIIGLVKPQKSLWITGAALIFTGFISLGVAVSLSIRKTASFVQENIVPEMNKSIHQSSMVAGQTFGQAVSGFGSGMGNVIFEAEVYPNPDLELKGVMVGVVDIEDAAQQDSDVAANAISIYTLFESDFKGKLRLTGYYGDKPTGRSDIEVDYKAGDEAYLEFPFNDRVDLEGNSFYELDEITE